MIDAYGIRRVTDDEGLGWDVWEAHPRLAERRRVRDRRSAERPDRSNRRTAPADSPLPIADAEGWLVFRSTRDERRRTPIPPGWELMEERRLLDVLHRSRATAPLPRVRKASRLSSEVRLPAEAQPSIRPRADGAAGNHASGLE